MADQTGAFIWYELLTPDPDAAKAFYDAVVGWDIEPQPAGPLDYRMIRHSGGGNAGGVMRLSPDMASNGGRPVWLGYLAVGDVDSTVSAVVADGGKVHMPPTDMPGVGRIAMVTDPAGAPMYVMRPTPPPGQPDAVSDVFSVDQPQHVRWNELTTSDSAVAIDFYRRHFGWTQEGSMPMGPAGDYMFVQQGGVGIGAIMPKMQPDAPVGWTYYIGVDDIDRATAAVNAGGGKVLMGPHEIPGGEFSLIGVDPQGASFGLVGPRKGEQQ
ncbi:VOC family protein [Sphingomonas humi]|uniref:VOC family protein n=1 Tax=Sphingomonas humi TaxID=335630 RepID=A0ABP7RHY4_9SPHN